MRAVAGPMTLLLLAACGDGPIDPRGVDREEALVQVIAAGRAESRPDEAGFTAGVQTIGPTAAAASAENNAEIGRVIAALEARGVRRDDVQTRSISVARIEHGRDRGRYQASNMIEVRLRDIARAGEAIAAATDAGANVLSGPNLRTADPEAASRSAYAAAYRAARARADAYAEAAGMRVARVLAIRDAGEGGIPDHIRYGMEAMNAESGPAPVAPPPVRAGVSTSQVQVRVDFALAPR